MKNICKQGIEDTVQKYAERLYLNYITNLIKP